MPARIAMLFALSFCSMLLYASEPMLGPVIEKYGPTYPIKNRDVLLEEGNTYKAVFDVSTYSDDLTSISDRLESVARYLNMHARNGVPVESMKLAIVVHGGALKNLLSDKSYRTRYNSDNPNLELLNALHNTGVNIFVCGQSMSFGGVGKDEITDVAQVALSAMTMLTVLQNDGYALLP